MERAFGAISKVLSERGGGVKRNSGGGGKVVFGVVACRRFAQDFAHEQALMALDDFIVGHGEVVMGRRSVWAGGAEIPVEDEFGRVDHRGHNRKGWGASEEEQLKVGPEGARRAGASESKCTEGHFKQKNSQKKSPRLSASFDKLQFLIFYSVLSVSSVVSSSPTAHPCV